MQGQGGKGRMDLSLRRKGVWIAGSLCLLSSPVLWRVLRSVMTRGGHRQAPALEDTQAKEQAWSLPGLKDTAPATTTDERTAAPAADAPAPPAPFDHRIVTARQAAVNSFYTVSRTEILGGGRFGQVHKCEEKATGLKLAAKIIKTRGVKDKDDVKNEISVMNQLDHVNLIQLYDAFESKNDIVLVME